MSHPAARFLRTLLRRAAALAAVSGAVAFFVGGIVASEVIFSWATAAELQPQIDGLSFDEALLGGLVVGVPVVLLAWWANRRRHIHGPTAV